MLSLETTPKKTPAPGPGVTSGSRIDQILESRGEPLLVPGQSDVVEAKRTKEKPKSPALPGSFPPPKGTLQLGVDRQPNGFTCGPETYQGIADLLRLPVRNPDQGTEQIQGTMGTSGKYGTEPYAIANAARDHLGIEAKVVKHMTIKELAGLVNGAQAYIDELLAGKTPDKPLQLVQITYQAYMGERERSDFNKGDKKENLPVRSKDGRVLWQNDYNDGHYSAVSRVVLPNENTVIRRMAQQAKNLGYDALKDGVVILADPSNGLGLSFIPLPEFDARWQDSNRDNQPVFPHTGIVYTVSVEKLKEMKKVADKEGVPMFSTVVRNSVIYVP